MSSYTTSLISCEMTRRSTSSSRWSLPPAATTQCMIDIVPPPPFAKACAIACHGSIYLFTWRRTKTFTKAASRAKANLPGHHLVLDRATSFAIFLVDHHSSRLVPETEAFVSFVKQGWHGSVIYSMLLMCGMALYIYVAVDLVLFPAKKMGHLVLSY
jgi:hypothetical protein